MSYSSSGFYQQQQQHQQHPAGWGDAYGQDGRKGGGARGGNENNFSGIGGGSERQRKRRSPYEVLGVSPDATQSQIKAAYRRLALKYHPDRIQGTAEEKAIASEKFAEIGAAYELLTKKNSGDGNEASHPSFAHDHEYSNSSRSRGGYQEGEPAFVDPFFDFDDWFMRGHGKRSRRGGGGFAFSDPFDLFRATFGLDNTDDDFMFSNNHHRRAQPNNTGFSSSHHQHAPSGMGMGFRMSATGGGMDSLFSSFFGPSLLNQSIINGDNSIPGGGFSTSFSYSSSSGGGMRGGATSSYSSYSTSAGGGGRTTTTKTTISNGRRQTRTETTVIKPDGTREVTIDLSGDADEGGEVRRLPSSSTTNAAPTTTVTAGKRPVSDQSTTQFRSGRVHHSDAARGSDAYGGHGKKSRNTNIGPPATSDTYAHREDRSRQSHDPTQYSNGSGSNPNIIDCTQDNTSSSTSNNQTSSSRGIRLGSLLRPLRKKRKGNGKGGDSSKER